MNQRIVYGRRPFYGGGFFGCSFIGGGLGVIGWIGSITSKIVLPLLLKE